MAANENLPPQMTTNFQVWVPTRINFSFNASLLFRPLHHLQLNTPYPHDEFGSIIIPSPTQQYKFIDINYTLLFFMVEIYLLVVLFGHW